MILTFVVDLWPLTSSFVTASSRNESHNKCPLCQSNLDTIDESWVLPDLPKTDEVNEKILTELNALAYSSSSENEQHEDDGDGDD